MSVTKRGRYDYNIVTRKHPLPFGENLFLARLDSLWKLNKKEGEPSTRLGTPEGLAERWGKTEAEAYKKMVEAIEQWISEQR